MLTMNTWTPKLKRKILVTLVQKRLKYLDVNTKKNR